MKRIFVFFTVLYFAAFGWGKIPLEQAIKNGIQKNYSLINENISKKIISLEKEIAEKEKLFSLNFGGFYIYKSEQPELNMPDINPAPGITIPGIHMTAGTKHIFDFQIGLKQPLYSGGILSLRAKIPEIKNMQNKYKKELLENSISTSIKLTFLNYEYLLIKKRQLELTLKNLENHLKRLKEFYKEELIKKSDIIETELKCEELRINIKDLEIAISDAEKEFKKLTGININEIDENFKEPVLPLKESLKYLTNNHPFIKNLETNIELIDISKKIEKGKYLPQISAFGETHYGKPGIDFFKDEWSLYFQGGITIGLRLFDWGKLKKTRKIYDYSIKKIKNSEKDFIENSSKDLKKLYDAKKILENKLKISERLLTLSKENSVLKEKLFKEKQINNTDYISSVLKKETYASLNEMLKLQLEIIKIKINSLICRR